MRHAVCGNPIEIRTDPRNTAYEVVSGGRRREEAAGAGDSLVGDGPALAAAAAIMTDKERNDGREHAFANLEKTIADRAAAVEAAERVDELRDVAARRWEDPYARNRRLRQAFRVGRKMREGEEARTEDLKDRMSLGIELVAAREEDAARAKLVDFGPVEEVGPGQIDRALATPLFGDGRVDEGGSDSGREPPERKSKAKSKLKSEVAASRMRESLVSEVVSNTRAAMDPFLAFGNNSKEASSKTSTRLPGVVRRKRPAEDMPDAPEREPPAKTAATASLVSYDSD
jgi:coiled-coil domain-containing protein 130